MIDDLSTSEMTSRSTVMLTTPAGTFLMLGADCNAASGGTHPSKPNELSKGPRNRRGKQTYGKWRFGRELTAREVELQGEKEVSFSYRRNI